MSIRANTRCVGGGEAFVVTTTIACLVSTGVYGISSISSFNVYKYSQSHPSHLYIVLFIWQLVSTLNLGHL